MQNLVRLLLRATYLVFLVLVLQSGCVTTDPDSSTKIESAPSAPKAPARSGRTKFPRLTINGAEHDNLGSLVRAIGEQGKGGGIALVAGLEDRPAAPVALNGVAYREGLGQLVGPADCIVHEAHGYQLICPPGYESLLAVSVWEQVHPRFRKLHASFAVGAGTDMYNALALLSENSNVTIIADNVIADVWCGELFLHDAPVATIVEALLQSARVVPDAFVVESTERYLFVRSTANKTAQDACVNRGELTDELRASLEKLVDVRMPGGDGVVQFQREALSLHAVLPELSRQLGVAVSAEGAMAEFPVNQALFRDLSINEVLNLIVRQWPLSQFGYKVDADGIRFCVRKSP